MSSKLIPEQQLHSAVDGCSSDQEICYFYGIRTINVVFTKARHWFLSWTV